MCSSAELTCPTRMYIQQVARTQVQIQSQNHIWFGPVWQQSRKLLTSFSFWFVYCCCFVLFFVNNGHNQDSWPKIKSGSPFVYGIKINFASPSEVILHLIVALSNTIVWLVLFWRWDWLWIEWWINPTLNIQFLIRIWTWTWGWMWLCRWIWTDVKLAIFPCIIRRCNLLDGFKFAWRNSHALKQSTQSIRSYQTSHQCKRKTYHFLGSWA